MKWRSIDLLDNRSQTNESDYDLTQTVWKKVNSVNYFLYIVDKFDEMRIDTICNKIYGTTNHVDFLLFLNDIINPLNIKEGDTIIYVNSENIFNYKVDPDEVRDIRGQLINLSKIKKVDTKRREYNDEKSALPPTVKQTNSNPVTFENGQVIIKSTR